jgi:hypothetical protein
MSYDVAFSKSGLKQYLSKYKTPLKEASDGKTYLPKGTYEVVLRMGSQEEKRQFKIN